MSLSVRTSAAGRCSRTMNGLYAWLCISSRPHRKPSRDFSQSYGSVRKAGSIAGGSSGLALRKVTEPMLRGRRWQVLMVMPWPLTRIRPWSMT